MSAAAPGVGRKRVISAGGAGERGWKGLMVLTSESQMLSRAAWIW